MIWSRRRPRLVPLAPRAPGAVAPQSGFGPQAGAAEAGAPGGDRLYWPVHHRTGDADRGTRAALRAMTFVALGMMLCLVMSLSVFGDLLPLRRDVPYFLDNYGEGRTVVELKPARRVVEADDEQIRREVAKFVMVMFTIIADKDEMSRRWGPDCAARLQAIDYSSGLDSLCSYVWLRTSVNDRPTRAWERFASQLQAVKTFIDEGKSRVPRIIGDPIFHGGGRWEVRVEWTDYLALGERTASTSLAPFEREAARRGKAIAHRQQAVFLRVRFGEGAPVARRIAYRLNPLQFTVVDITDITDIPNTQ